MSICTDFTSNAFPELSFILAVTLSLFIFWWLQKKSTQCMCLKIRFLFSFGFFSLFVKYMERELHYVNWNPLDSFGILPIICVCISRIWKHGNVRENHKKEKNKNDITISNDCDAIIQVIHRLVYKNNFMSAYSFCSFRVFTFNFPISRTLLTEFSYILERWGMGLLQCILWIILCAAMILKSIKL